MCKRGDLRHGFSLIELSIVLTIIGLIIGSILLGQRMIEGAKIRNIVSQIEKYNSAVNTFHAKYGGLPGDLDNATQFGLGNNGDGDRLLTDLDGAVVDFTGELSNFWVHITVSGMLIEGVYQIYMPGDNDMTLETHFPRSNHGMGGIVAYNVGDTNAYHIGAVSNTIPNDTLVFSDTLTTEQAQSIDHKLDDGIASLGSIVAVTGTTIATNADDCLDVVNARDDYALGTAGVVCQLQLRMQ